MRRFIAVVALLLCASWLCKPICAFAQTNLVKNGDLASGFDGAPADWYALSSDKKLTKFSWSYTPAGGGVLSIANNSRTFSSWHQALMLRPGIYQVTAEARVEGAMPAEGGANIAISTYDGIQLISNHLQGTDRSGGRFRFSWSRIDGAIRLNCSASSASGDIPTRAARHFAISKCSRSRACHRRVW